MARGRSLACILALLLFVGCSGDRTRAGAPSRTWQDDPSLPCPNVTGSSRNAASGAIRAESVADIVLEVPVGRVRLWGHYLAFTPADYHLVVCDLHTGRWTTVDAREEGSSEAFGDPVGSGEVVVYTALASVPTTEPNRKTRWTLEARNLRSGKRWHVAEGAAGFLSLPYAAVAGPWIAWTEVAEDGATASIRSFDLRDGRRRTVASVETQGREPAGVGVVGDLVVFEDRGPQGSDLFSVPGDGSASPRRITSQGTVVGPLVANGRLTWKSRPAAGETERWTTTLEDGSQPVRLPLHDEAVVPGPDFLVAERRGTTIRSLAVFDTTDPGAPPVPLVDGERETLDVASHWTVHADLVAFVTIEAAAGSTARRHMRITRVTRDGAGSG